MKKKQIYGDTLKAQLIAGSKDRLTNFLLADGAIRGVISSGTKMVNEMRSNHELGILETIVLGRAYLGAALMSADLKSDDRICLKFDCAGPIKGLTVEANAFAEVRGFLKNVPIPIEKPMENFDLSPFFGSGFLSVTKYLQDAKHPFTGQVALEYGNIALDLANYYLISEQIPTAFNLSIKFDKQGKVIGAGGLMLQAMPEARDHLVSDLETKLLNLPSLGIVFKNGQDPESFVQRVFQNHRPEFLANRRLEFMCHCNHEKVRSLLTMLPLEDLEDILAKGPFPLEMRCHYCNTVYEFGRRDVREIYGRRFPNN
jgi:molecular chaperone Hsp33